MCLLFSIIKAEELDDLLEAYTYNSDLSTKTKHENGGTVTVYTRQDLEKMQARSLKDLLKSHPVLRYQESRAGLPDMFYRGGTSLSNSNNIRIYIDNQELTSATFGSGFLIANNINVDVMDHVEIYTRSPSYEFTTEPAYILIKLYTKLAERDRGGKLAVSYGNRDFNEEALFYADELEDFSYVASLTRRDDRKKTYYSHNIPIDRDSENLSFLGVLYSDAHKLQLFAGDSDLGTSIGRSPRATYAVSRGKYDFVNIAYENTSFDDLFFSIAFQQANIQGANEEAAGYTSPLSPSYEYDRQDEVLTAELKYDFETEFNRLIIGAKYRHKSFEFQEGSINGIPILEPLTSYTEQEVLGLYAEERYSLSDHNIINIAGQYTHVTNNGDIGNDHLIQFRLNHTYLYDNYTFKSFVYRVESLVEPSVYIDFTTTPSLDTQVLNAFSEEIKYEQDKNELKFVFTYNVIENLIEQSKPFGAYVNRQGKIHNTSAFLEHTYHFNMDNKLISNITYNYIKERSKNDTAAYVRLLNTVGKFDIFNEVVYNYTDFNKEHYFDYSAGVKYHYSDALILSIKGENIFDTGYEDSYFRIDPNTFIPEEPIQISPVEQRVYLSMEYLF